MSSPLPQLPKLYKHPLISDDLGNLKSTQLQLLVIASRENLEVYKEAMKRLKDLPSGD